MRLRTRSRTLLTHTILWIVLPFSLLVIGLLITGAIVYQQVVTSLLIDRDRQTASLTASSVSEGLGGYMRVLEALSGNSDLRSDSPTVRRAALENATDALAVFNVGVAVVGEDGVIHTVVPNRSLPDGLRISDQPYFRQALERRRPVFGDMLTSTHTAEPMVVIAVPVTDARNRSTSVLLGAAYLRTSSLSDLVRSLIVGNEGHAYLVGQRGQVIYHRDSAMIGEDYNHIPSVARAIAGHSGGLLRQTPTGESVVEGYAPIPIAGWGVIVQESWDAAVAPVQTYSLVLAIIALVAVALSILVMWQVVRRSVSPIRSLAEQTQRLARGEAIEPIRDSGILELDALKHAFGRMARQIALYRAGLRRYVGAITKSQEEERQRISRELHDETVQSLVAINRQLELYQASEQSPDRLAQFGELQARLRDVVQGVRQISRNLRPLILEDLGLVPALRSLVNGVREGDGTVPQAEFRLIGSPHPLSPEQELALYRITQEALTNAQKHSRATGVRVELEFASHAVRLDVVDDGEGFQVPDSLAQLAERGSFGLMGIQERVWVSGGVLSIASNPGRGTHLSVEIPFTDG